MYYRFPKQEWGGEARELGEGQSSIPGLIPGPEPSGDREPSGDIGQPYYSYVVGLRLLTFLRLNSK